MASITQALTFCNGIISRYDQMNYPNSRVVSIDEDVELLPEEECSNISTLYASANHLPMAGSANRLEHELRIQVLAMKRFEMVGEWTDLFSMVAEDMTREQLTAIRSFLVQTAVQAHAVWPTWSLIMPMQIPKTGLDSHVFKETYCNLPRGEKSRFLVEQLEPLRATVDGFSFTLERLAYKVKKNMAPIFDNRLGQLAVTALIVFSIYKICDLSVSWFSQLLVNAVIPRGSELLARYGHLYVITACQMAYRATAASIDYTVRKPVTSRVLCWGAILLAKSISLKWTRRLNPVWSLIQTILWPRIALYNYLSWYFRPLLFRICLGAEAEKTIVESLRHNNISLDELSHYTAESMKAWQLWMYFMEKGMPKQVLPAPGERRGYSLGTNL